ncbi:alpha/beta fold hydrolase [Oceanibacterium hippocampi]|uniref:3-oxoadipate enol-lactonase 2 n=1 Tax=Oceanibacterium hippocampi TaxID=745714 RepID=A0A1Y5TYM7_9PROT|nr:alpha/beta hydrolase [Oceanibacterium hippocampi]SLN77107.1 3-oxoadipate enol-lactonase 2 [Oceanibacterium hippocampi]
MALAFRDIVFHAQDDLPLYYRDYGDHDAPRTPLVCLGGLTRNSKDFHDFAQRYADERRVVALDLRGRGRSGYDTNFRNYRPETYLLDIVALLAAANLHRAVFVGTSLGGLLTMGLAAFRPSVLAGVVLNDVGPAVSADGSARIAGYVGEDKRFADLDEAAEHLRGQFTGAYPDLDAPGWKRMAAATFVADDEAGNVRLDYDLAIGKALREQLANGATPDLWPLFGALRSIPTLLIHGARSDVLSLETVQAMRAVKPDLEIVTLANRGHTPNLDEAELLPRLDAFLERF